MAAFVRAAAGRNGRVADANNLKLKEGNKFSVGNGGLGRKPLQTLDNLASALTGRCNVGGKKNANAKATEQYDWQRQPLKNVSNNAGAEGKFKSSNATERSTLSRLLDQRSRQANKDIADIDSVDKKNPQAVAQYACDIYNHFKEAERIYHPQDYMSSQTDINEKMRSILMDWLIEVHIKFKLMPETLYLTIQLIDRFLAKKQTNRKNLQLVGITAMLLASKYEEIWSPEVKDFVFISDKAYTRQQLLQMERVMLNTLKYRLTVPTHYHFLLRYLKAAKADKKCEHYAFFLTELALVNYKCIKYPTSLIATASIYAALRTLNKNSWPRALQQHSGYLESEVRDCAAFLADLHKSAGSSSLRAVTKKYSSSRLGQVARITPYDFN
jgi:cyclin B